MLQSLLSVSQAQGGAAGFRPYPTVLPTAGRGSRKRCSRPRRYRRRRRSARHATRPSIRPRAACAGVSPRAAGGTGSLVRIQAMVVDPLQSTQCRLVHAGRPERQPGLHRRTIDLAVVEVAFDDRSQVRPRTVVVDAPRAYGLAQGAEQVPHGRFQQAVLVLEVVADDAVGNTRQAGNQGDAGVSMPT